MRIMWAAAALAGAASATLAAQDAADDFGTREEARALAERLVAIIDAEAIYDPAQPFLASRMGVNLFRGSMVIADNREPETVAADYAAISDLTGEAAWPRISAAASLGGADAILKWYHYDTQEIYDYRCFAMKADRDDGHVMVCR